MGLLSFLLDLYENTRKTTTNEKNNKLKERNYNFDSGFTGDKKIDSFVNKSSEFASKVDKDDREI